MLTIDDIKKFLTDDSDENRHGLYEASVKIALDIRETFSDKYPAFLDVSRPNETKKQKDYREAIFVNPVKAHKMRIVDKVQKVVQSEDFFINYSEGSEVLKAYCEDGFGGFGNLKTWVFTKALNAYMNDPNAVVAVFEKTPVNDEKAVRKPFPHLFSSGQVLWFKRNKSAVILSNEKSLIESNGKFIREGKVFYCFDEVNYYIVRQIANREIDKTIIGDYEIVIVRHYCKDMPVWKVGRYIEELADLETEEELYKSLLSDTLPHWRRALNRYNDIEIELVHHIHSKEWQIKPKKCKDCSGSGKISTVDKRNIKCTKCGGKGITSWTALDIIEIDFENDDSFDKLGKFPFSQPGGFIARSIEPLKELWVAYHENVKAGYESIDMGILNQSNLAQSGVAKQYDRLEFSQKLYAEGSHLITNILLKIYICIDAQMFGASGVIGSQVPDVTVPISFDIMGSDAILEELEKALKAEANVVIRGKLNVKYAELVLGKYSLESKLMRDEMALNPLYGFTVDERMVAYGGGAGSITASISQIDYVLGNSYKSFVDRALIENTNWLLLENSQKREILIGYAKEMIDENKAQMGTSVMMPFTNVNNGGLTATG